MTTTTTTTTATPEARVLSYLDARPWNNSTAGEFAMPLPDGKNLAMRRLFIRNYFMYLEQEATIERVETLRQCMVPGLCNWLRERNWKVIPTMTFEFVLDETLWNHFCKFNTDLPMLVANSNSQVIS